MIGYFELLYIEFCFFQAMSFGLHRSVLERLMSCPLYATAEGSECCTQLVHNYRTHPDILKLPRLEYSVPPAPPLLPSSPLFPPPPPSPLSLLGVVHILRYQLRFPNVNDPLSNIKFKECGAQILENPDNGSSIM